MVTQDKLYAYVSLGGRHQNTSLNTTDTQSPSWSDTLTFEHPTSEHTEISVAVYAKHTLLPDTLVGSAGKVESTCFRSRWLRYTRICSVCLTGSGFDMSAEYPISRISSSEQLRVPLLDKSGSTTGELVMSVNTGGYGSKLRCSDVVSDLTALQTHAGVLYQVFSTSDSSN